MKLFSNERQSVEAIEIETKLNKIFEGYKRRYKKFFIILRDSKQKAVGYTLNEKTIAVEDKLDGIFILTLLNT